MYIRNTNETTSVKKFSDQEILDGILSGKDDKVLEFLYDTLLPEVKKLVKKYRGTDDEAYDVFQEGILKFYWYVKQGKFDTKFKIAGFIYTISKNLYIDYLRRQNKSVSIKHTNDLVIADLTTPLGTMITEEKEAKIMELFSQIGNVCKELLVYSFFHDLSMKEISEKMGFNSEDVAKTKKYKCKQRLIQLIKEDLSYKNIIQHD